MSIHSIRFVANEIAWFQVSHGLMSRDEMADMALNIIEYHNLDIEVSDYDWLEGVIIQRTHELKPEWRLAQ